MTERRYSEEEIASIFDEATRAESARLSAAKGLTLSELQAIGREVGVSPDAVAAAAARVDQPSLATAPPAEVNRRLFGLPIGVGRTIDLPRKLTDSEWEQLVTDLRITFDARGKVTSEGGWREWRNGNLQARVEPAGSADRLRIRTIKGTARMWLTNALITLGGAATIFGLAAIGVTENVDAARGSAFLALLGVGMFGATAARLPSWARLRRQQIDVVISRLIAALNTPKP